MTRWWYFSRCCRCFSWFLLKMKITDIWVTMWINHDQECGSLTDPKVPTDPNGVFDICWNVNFTMYQDGLDFFHRSVLFDLISCFTFFSVQESSECWWLCPCHAVDLSFHSLGCFFERRFPLEHFILLNVLGALELLVFPLLGATHSARLRIHSYRELPWKIWKKKITETETFRTCIYRTDVWYKGR